MELFAQQLVAGFSLFQHPVAHITPDDVFDFVGIPQEEEEVAVLGVDKHVGVLLVDLGKVQALIADGLGDGAGHCPCKHLDGRLGGAHNVLADLKDVVGGAWYFVYFVINVFDYILNMLHVVGHSDGPGVVGLLAFGDVLLEGAVPNDVKGLEIEEVLELVEGADRGFHACVCVCVCSP